MEEQVGEIWHRFITRAADTRHHEAEVTLESVRASLGVFFRALGGDPGLQVELANTSEYGARRSWLQRIAGNQRTVEWAWRDDRSLRMPPRIAWFRTAELNRDLYFWLAAMAVADTGQQLPWFMRNQLLTLQALARFPGLIPRYERLVIAHLKERPDPTSLKGAEAEVERAIRAVLVEPGSIHNLPPSKHAPSPVVFWLHPNPPQGAGTTVAPMDDAEPDRSQAEQEKTLEEMARRQAERAETPEEDRGLITVRMENIFTFNEYIKLDRGAEDEDNLDRAEDVARDIDQMAVNRDSKPAKTRLKFDMDLPSEAADDTVLGDGILLPEWDWKKQSLIPDHCRIVPLMATEAESIELPDPLKPTAKRLRNQFQALAPARVWHRAQPDGQEIDIDAYLRFASDRAAGHSNAGDSLYRELRTGARDLACLLLADLSLSTDTWVDDYHRVIDVIRDSLFLFAEALHATGDQCALYGFSSRKRDPVRFHTLKTFAEDYDGKVRGRIQAIRPGYYTRLGAGIRYSTELLKDQPAGRRLLLILTDGKPNDLDQYEGRYGIEDTRQAIQAAHRLGLQPFCVTIDEKGNEYLPHLFGNGGYVVIRDPRELPKQLPLLYARLTA